MGDNGLHTSKSVGRKPVVLFNTCELNEQHLNFVYDTHKDSYYGWWLAMTRDFTLPMNSWLFAWYPRILSQNNGQNATSKDDCLAAFPKKRIQKFQANCFSLPAGGNPVICNPTHNMSSSALAFFASNRPWDRHSKAWKKATMLKKMMVSWVMCFFGEMTGLF